MRPGGRIDIPCAPAIHGLSFRHFRGEADFPALASVLMASENADGIHRHLTSEDLATAYQHLDNCNPYQDMIIAECAGEVIGYTRAWWWDESSSARLYGMNGFLLPAWRRKGIGLAMTGWGEGRLREIAGAHPVDLARFFQVDVSQSQDGKASMLHRAGYRAVRYFYQMLRPTLDDLPDWPLPPGLELRPVSSEDYPALWRSIDETSQDEWGYTAPTEDAYQAWLSGPHFQPHLWQVAWDTATGRIAGHVLTFIDHDENTQFDRRRGYTEGIGVDRSWRRRGLARALIARSLHAQKSAGMSESALVADSESASGVTRLYESCGFNVVGQDAIYRKAF